jgi:signal transduction histidine kinase
VTAAEQGGERRLGFKRHFVWPGLIVGVGEIVFVVVPLLNLFGRSIDDDLLVRVALPVLAGAQAVWWLAVGSWLSPTYRAIREKRRGQRLGGDLAAAAYRTTIRMPLYVLVLRTLLWAVAAATVGLFLIRFSDWTTMDLIEIVGAATVLAFAASTVRAFWYGAILARIRLGLFASVPALRQFADSYRLALVLAVVAISGITGAAITAFVYFSLPIEANQFISVLATLPASMVVAIAAVVAYAIRVSRPLSLFLRAQLEPPEDGDFEAGTRGAPGPTAVYRLSQSLPYRLAAAQVAAWMLLGSLVGYAAQSRFRVHSDDSILLVGIIAVIAIGASLYQAIWHRELIRPLLDHLTVSHRLPVRGIRPALSLRGKLLLSFGGMVLFACGLALFWGFIQYKKLVTDFTAKQAELGIDWLRSEVVAAAAGRDRPPTPDLVGQVLRGVEGRRRDSTAVFYYLPPDSGGRLIKLGGGLMGAPVLPWYARAQLRLPGEGKIVLGSHSLSGRRARLEVPWRDRLHDLGVVAVFYPNYRGRGVAVVREIRDLLLFFLFLFGACAGIVLLTVAQFVKPIRRLEQRADGMARGELARPVSSGGEGDEIGRLTFALEEMRRALREKLRSTEEVNLDLERAVQRRTADLAKKNRELAETLGKLTRAQDQLLRSEKMASIGQLVAGIAHEINNPVNAIVNTVGPLAEALESIDRGSPDERAEAARDVTDMLRVVRRGAERTKAIVQALHNYSRTDDESVVAVDINRSLEDSLALLRHLLKQSIRVERRYRDVGRIRGHAGQLNQVFVNLLANAAQAVSGREDAEIVIETEGTETGAVVRIRDNGEGISPEVLPRIFDPFFTTKDVGEGSGLGLSIVHGIVERHGGSIEVESEPGVGTTFTVGLPRAASPEEMMPRHMASGRDG